MKSRILLASGAILICLIAIGCANNDRSTAPANSMSTLNLPGDEGFNRIDFPGSGPVTNRRPPWIALRGQYFRDEIDCETIVVKSDEHIELLMQAEVPANPENFDRIEVRGVYSTDPGYVCGLPNMFVVYELNVLPENHADPVGDIGGSF
jgi:hypothetical protein